MRHRAANHGHRRTVTVNQRLRYRERSRVSSQLNALLGGGQGQVRGRIGLPTFRFQAGIPAPIDHDETTAKTARFAVSANGGGLVGRLETLVGGFSARMSGP